MHEGYTPEVQTMLDVLEELVEKIGPRPAGGPAEAQAMQCLKNWFSGWGYQISEFSFSFAGYPKFNAYYALPAFVFMVAAWFQALIPWLALLLPVLIAALPELWQAWNRRRRKTRSAKNLFALPNGLSMDQLDLILCAHVDTARHNPVLASPWRKLLEQVFATMLRVAWLLIMLSIFYILGFEVPRPVAYAVGIVYSLFGLYLIVMDMLEQFGHHNLYVAGAHDNASGVAVLAAVARALAQNESSARKVGFLFTSAEETGMWGAQAFAEHMAANGLSIPVMVLDQVGAGQTLRVVTGVGRFRPMRSDDIILQALRRADPAAEDLFYIYRNGDFSEFLRVGIPAVSLETSGSLRAKEAYHTTRDTLRVIDPKTLEHVYRTVMKYLQI
ncbi:MAG: hypothetical protein CVU39_28285 [Chloroflexi bacterium HGW-Chloroflexi-10]|nr:MAG: hypothetical protein CVU39_28285 [Chloroflexi bacterium HGW-Chloroflexi-10]